MIAGRQHSPSKGLPSTHANSVAHAVNRSSGFAERDRQERFADSKTILALETFTQKPHIFS
jgi:hypothetical protein